VAARGTRFNIGFLDKPSLPFLLCNNSKVFGYTDYNWRAEAGDWRFFWTDIEADAPPTSGSPFLVVKSIWQKPGTDIDTVILGPTADDFTPSTTYGPYTLEEVGRSAYTYIGSGRWIPQTSSGINIEVVSAPAQEGLHGILLHQVKVDGTALEEWFGGAVGMVTVDPGAVSASGPAGTGSMKVTISSELELPLFTAEGFGLGTPVTTRETVYQDDPDDPATASFVTTVDIEHGARLEVSTCCSAGGSDIDLYVYGPDGRLLASSTTPIDEEYVSILFPEDGTYTIAVHGWSVPAGVDTFDLTINAVQGYDVTVSDVPSHIPAGGTATLTVQWDTTGKAPGTYYGLVLMGPITAPGLLEVPVEIVVE